MADAAVTKLVEQVTEVIQGYPSLISNADREFKDLKDDLIKLKAILEETRNNPREDAVIKLIENRIQEVVYEVEDSIDTCMTEAMAAKSKGFIGRVMHRAKAVSMAEQVKFLKDVKVKQMLENAIKIRSVHPAEDATAEEQAMRIKKNQVTLRPQSKIVGLEDVEVKMKEYLSTIQKGLDIISIIGMPGLGKSTLAWKVFNSPETCHDFPIRIWVHVSQSFNSKEVFLEIIEKFTTQDMTSFSTRELSQRVHACLEEEKFMLVLDDVWKTEHWDAIMLALPYHNGRGKVMVTSRNTEVGKHAKTITNPYSQRFLTPEESWTLLQLEVFGVVGSCPEKLEGLGYSIAESCGGVPLTLVVFAGILKDQYLKKKKSTFHVEKEWAKVNENMNLGLQTDEEKENVISKLVELSYNMLPYDLRECFLYLGVFPPNYLIQTWTLTRLWIAEGFILPRDGKSLEQIADENLDDLVSRNLLIADDINPIGEVKTCHVHDMIRRFCRSKAKDNNLFLEIMMSGEGVAPKDSASKLEDVYRLCLHSDPSKYFALRLKSPLVRTFLCFRKEPIDLDPKFNQAIPNSFPLLRILHSKSIRFEQFPGNLTKLIHLRYIILCVDRLDELPESISELWKLQVIVVNTKARTLKMKPNLWNMLRLRHLKTKAAIVLDPTWKGAGGKNLQTLSRVSPDHGMETISKQASNLTSLGVRGKIATLLIDKSLKCFNYLEKLKLVNDLGHESPSSNQLGFFPGRDHFPINLRRLTLSDTYLDWKHMATLATIGKLEVIKLKANAFQGISWEATDSVFESLQYLLIANADLVVWEASENTFPSLRCLVIKNCEKLEEIPICVANHLQNLDIQTIRRSVADSARKIKEKIEENEAQVKGNFTFQFNLNVGPNCDLA